MHSHYLVTLFSSFDIIFTNLFLKLYLRLRLSHYLYRVTQVKPFFAIAGTQCWLDLGKITKFIYQFHMVILVETKKKP